MVLAHIYIYIYKYMYIQICINTYMYTQAFFHLSIYTCVYHLSVLYDIAIATAYSLPFQAYSKLPILFLCSAFVPVDTFSPPPTSSCTSLTGQPGGRLLSHFLRVAIRQKLQQYIHVHVYIYIPTYTCIYIYIYIYIYIIIYVDIWGEDISINV